MEEYIFWKTKSPDPDYIKDELNYLYRFFEMMFPGDYLLKCAFYKTGVKINRDRILLKKSMINHVV